MTEHILAVDAGVSTGWVLGQQPSNPYNEGFEILDFGQFKHDHWEDTVTELLTKFTSEPTTLVIEQFDLRPNNKFRADLTTVKVNSTLSYCATAWNPKARIIWQTPGQAKGVITDKALKALGFWPTGKTVGCPDADDVRDAARHFYYYAIKTCHDANLAARMGGRHGN